MTALSTQKQEPYIPLMERVHQGTVKRFSSELDMKASYSGSRKRCFKPAKRPLPVEVEASPKESIDIIMFRIRRLLAEQRKSSGIFASLKIHHIRSSLPCASEIIKSVAAKHNLYPADITGSRRNKFIVAARDAAIAEIAERRTDLSLPQIGQIFNRDHTTIYYSLSKQGIFRESRYTRNTKAA